MLVSADTVRLAFLRTTPPPTIANQALLARITGETITMAPTTVVSGELDPSMQVRDSIVTGAATTGAVNYEASRNPWLDEMLSAAVYSEWGVGSYNAVPLTADQLIAAKELKPSTTEKDWTMV